MTEKLDQYAPTQEMLNGIKQQLLRAGIAEDNIPMDWLAASAAAMEKWMRTTNDGLRYLVSIFDFKLKKSEDTKEYTLVDNFTYKAYTLKTSQVWFYEGYLVDGVPIPLAEDRQGNFIPPMELEISDLTKTKCDGCGIVSHCTQEVLEPATDTLMQMCNFCLTFHSHPRVNERGFYEKCKECSLMHCSHHHAKQNRA